METACLRQHEIPGASRLYLDFLYSFEKVERFFPGPPFDLETCCRVAQAVQFPRNRRDALIAALAEINPPGALLDQLEDPETVVVATGQQNGLYGGPAYSVYKALTAVALARRLTRAGHPAVPVFWIATEDHDFAEIDHVWVFNRQLQPLQLRATGVVGPQEPVGGVRIDRLPAGELRAALGELPYSADVLALAERAYQPGRTFGDCFRELMASLLGPDYPVLFLDPLRPSIRELAAPFLAEAARRSEELTALVAARSQELLDCGYHAQVLVDAHGGSLFFVLQQETPNGPVRRTGLKQAEVAAFRGPATRLSPNALLRPLMQDYLMPVAVTVGGPAEIAYLAQAAPLYAALLGRQPVAVPRAGFTLIDARVAKLLSRSGLRLPDILRPGDVVRQAIAARLAPPSVQTVFAQTAAEIAASLDRWDRELRAFDATLAAALEKSRAKIAYQLEKTAAKVAREALRRDERARAETEALLNCIYPHRHLQERLYCLLPFLAAHGLDLIHRIYENIQVDCPDHHVLMA